VALLGARDEELELLAELHRNSRADLVGVYDPDPNAAGLTLAEIVGVPAGSDLAARDRLAESDFVVLPTNRGAFHRAIEWCSGLRAEMVGLDEARRRWGSVPAVDPPEGGLDARMRELDAASARLTSLATLGEWLLDTALRAVGATGGSLQLVSPDTSELYLLAARGLAEDVMRTSRHPVGEPISGLVAAMRTPQLLHGDHPARGPGQRGRVSSAISVPLLAEETLVGVLNVSSTAAGHRFGESELDQLQRLGPTFANLLERARVFQNGVHSSDATELLEVLHSLDAQGGDLAATLAGLCRNLCARIDADWLAIFLATEEGEWLRLGEAQHDPKAPRATCSRNSASTAFVQRRWLHVVEPPAQPPSGPDGAEESMAAVVDRAFDTLTAAGGALSTVYAPLVGVAPVGVLAAGFTTPAAAAAFLRSGEASVGQVALYVESRVRELHLRSRLERTTRLARLLPTLLEVASQNRLEAVLVREAAELVSAERALLRHVDEDRRTYSRPTLHGVPEANAEAWRALDTHVTESTLQRREVQLTSTLRNESDRLDQAPAYRSLVSVPIFQGERLVAVLNVYDKVPRHLLDGPAFTEFDRELLEVLGRAAASLLHTTPVPAAPTAPAGTNGPLAQPLADSYRLREELRRELARALRHNRQLGVSILQFKGLRELPESTRHRLLPEILGVLQDYVRRGDLVGWYAPDRLLIVSPESEPRNQELEARIRQLLSGERMTREGWLGLDVRMGTSCYPDDGDDPSTLLQAAVARLR
jgi:GAF domain-containing protein